KSKHENYFFFQAEDGIRDRNVTGVQTCALPISLLAQQVQVKRPLCSSLQDFMKQTRVKFASMVRILKIISVIPSVHKRLLSYKTLISLKQALWKIFAMAV